MTDTSRTPRPAGTNDGDPTGDRTGDPTSDHPTGGDPTGDEPDTDGRRQPRMPVPVRRLREGWDIRTLEAPARDVRVEPPLAPPPAPARRGPRFWISVAAAIIVFVLGLSSLILQRQLVAARDYAASVGEALEVAAAPGGLGAVVQSDSGVVGVVALDSSGIVTGAFRALAPTAPDRAYGVWLRDPAGNVQLLGSFLVSTEGVVTPEFGTVRVVPDSGEVLVALERIPVPGAPTADILAAGSLVPMGAASP